MVTPEHIPNAAFDLTRKASHGPFPGVTLNLLRRHSLCCWELGDNFGCAVALRFWTNANHGAHNKHHHRQRESDSWVSPVPSALKRKTQKEVKSRPTKTKTKKMASNGFENIFRTAHIRRHRPLDPVIRANPFPDVTAQFSRLWPPTLFCGA